MALPEELQRKWDEANRTGQPVDVGRIVVCDYCDRDYTDSPEPGGMIVESKTYCPQCAPRMMAAIERYNEQRFIKATCPPDQSFGDFVRQWRNDNGSNYIQVSTY